VISLLNLFNFPFGTVLGVYGLWVLFAKDTEGVFQTQELRKLGTQEL
jgi:hypothetical protein